MIQLLFRDHVDNEGEQLISSQLLRYILFWMCEKNYRDWQDDRLGVKVKAFLKTLYEALAKNDLPHYFIRGVNMLETMKVKTIRKLQVSNEEIY